MSLHPLDGALAKIGRAEENLKDLRREVARFVANHYAVSREAEDQNWLGYLKVKTSGTDASSLTPTRLLIGEILFQLRSSLEHVAWEMGKHVVQDAKARKRIHLPVSIRAADYKSTTPRIAGGPFKKADAFLETLQPYHRGDKYIHHWLYILNELAIVDRHRDLVLASPIANVSLYAPDGERLVFSEWVALDSNGGVQFRYHPVDEFGRRLPLETAVGMNIVPGLSIALGEVVPVLEPLDEFLGKLAHLTRGALEQFRILMT